MKKNIASKIITDKKELEQASKISLFICNGIIKKSKSNFVPTKPIFFKSNLLLRLILYAIFDILDNSERPYFGLIKKTIEFEENKKRFVGFINIKVKKDLDFPSKNFEETISTLQKIEDKSKVFYQSDYQTAYAKLNTYFFEIVKRKNREGRYVSYVQLNGLGKELYLLYEVGFVF